MLPNPATSSYPPLCRIFLPQYARRISPPTNTTRDMSPLATGHTTRHLDTTLRQPTPARDKEPTPTLQSLLANPLTLLANPLTTTEYPWRAPHAASALCMPSANAGHAELHQRLPSLILPPSASFASPRTRLGYKRNLSLSRRRTPHFTPSPPPSRALPHPLHAKPHPQSLHTTSGAHWSPAKALP